MHYVPAFLLALISVVSTLPARAAGLQGSISFTAAERAEHANGLDVIMRTASECLSADLDHHRAFFSEWGISPYYGSNSSFAHLSDSGRRAQLRRMGLPAVLVDQMEPTSCIGLTLKCLGKGFVAANEGALWARVKAFTVLNGVTGNSLQHALQGLGWKILYWNPDVSRNAAWDAEERVRYPGNPKGIWGYHASHWNEVRTKHRYLYNAVDDWRAMVNFGATVPRVIRDVPFFVGTAHGGYHVFPGSYGQIIEGHSTRAITDRLTVQTSPFSPLMEGGGPQGGPYKTGLVAIPPGYLR